MKCVVVLLIAAQAIICSGTVSPAYNPVFEYDVPVASQPLVYAPAAPHTPYGGTYGSYGSYAVHTTPAVSHSFSQTQTHPVAYVKPVSILDKILFRIEILDTIRNGLRIQIVILFLLEQRIR